jgi:ATP phosphoribosyltransferase regulatory subunit
LIDIIAEKDENRRLFLPLGTLASKAAQMRSEGWITVAALDEADNAEALDCAFMLKSGRAEPV